MLTIIAILLILWLLGFFGGPARLSIPSGGNLLYTLAVIALILIILDILGVL